ncbi:hypothetical protein [Actinomadura sp. 9N215]|uniref:hypothetical protein n=1 Tax=Actinomadura sp. 9N215 TaxID=3375150 RepID=UPI00378F7C4D
MTTINKWGTTLLAALATFTLVPVTAASATQHNHETGTYQASLDVAATTGLPRSAGPVKAVLLDGYCLDNTPLRVLPNETSAVQGTCQRAHSIDVTCYKLNSGTPPPYTYGLVNDRTINKVGYGRGDRIYVQQLPPECP